MSLESFLHPGTKRVEQGEKRAKQNLKNTQSMKPGSWTGPNAKGPGTLYSSSTRTPKANIPSYVKPMKGKRATAESLAQKLIDRKNRTKIV